MERLLKPQDAAELLGVSLHTLYTWVHRRQIPFQKVGHALRFSPTALSEWLSKQARPARSEADHNDA
ncbi:MAG: helix-turn-helix domain-containing protein [Candidatus Binatia bacterium]